MLWAKAEYPLRAALMASQLCQRLSTNPKLRADSDELTESFMAYEDLAIALLDAVRESDDAAPLLTLMPWEWSAGRGKGSVGRELLWDSSPLDSSSMEDGLLSLPCMRFVAHRHCQYTLDKYFAGDYPGSKAHPQSHPNPNPNLKPNPKPKPRPKPKPKPKPITLTLTRIPTPTPTPNP